MENLTHSLVGAALAELALSASATATQRRTFFVAGVIAANLPDADLLYTNITAPPIGYLLHHRGHTHTLLGLAGLAALIGVVCLAPRIRQTLQGVHERFVSLIVLCLLSHIVLDSWNSYGVHPFYPLDVKWYYGDVIFIVEPWFWLFLGVAATANAHGKASRIALGVLFAVASFVFAWTGFVPVAVFVALVIMAAVVALVTRGWSPRTRSGAALAGVALFVMIMFGVKHIVRDRVVASMAQGADLVDVILSPQVANPLCWTAIAVTKDEQAGTFTLSRGLASLTPMLRCGMQSSQQLEWTETLTQSLVTLRGLDRTDCRVAAWLQFGRAPALSADAIGDYRYGGISRGNFSFMELTPPVTAPSCPGHLTHWGKPRADLLRSP